MLLPIMLQFGFVSKTSGDASSSEHRTLLMAYVHKDFKITSKMALGVDAFELEAFFENTSHPAPFLFYVVIFCLLQASFKEKDACEQNIPNTVKKNEVRTRFGMPKLLQNLRDLDSKPFQWQTSDFSPQAFRVISSNFIILTKSKG